CHRTAGKMAQIDKGCSRSPTRSFAKQPVDQGNCRMEETEKIIAAVTVENDVRLQVLTGIKKRSIERCHERFARWPCKTRRYASQRINCPYIICSIEYIDAEMIADHMHIGPLVTARICGCERDAVKRLLRHGKCGADER